MQEIEVGDRVTCLIKTMRTFNMKDTFSIREEEIEQIFIVTSDINKIEKDKIKKIERIGTNGWYTVYEKEEKKELLTEEEKDFLKAYIKFNGKEIDFIERNGRYLKFYIKQIFNDYLEVSNFYFYKSYKNLEENKKYTLLELRIGGINVREIEFRGKDLLGRWQYGDLIQEKWKSKLNTKEKAYMIKSGNRATTVLEETIGEYTNRQDNKGNKIYTGDIVKSGEEIGVVVFDKEHLGYFVNFAEQEPLYDVYIEKIGNIVDNKELLEKENTDVK